MSSFNGATLLITGGTGSFGNTVLKYFLETDVGEIRIFSRNEKKQDDMRHGLQVSHLEQAKKVKFYIGNTERPEALDKGCFILSGITTKGLLQSVELAVAMNANGDYRISVPDYKDTNVSAKVVKIIQSYKDTINRFVWRKEI